MISPWLKAFYILLGSLCSILLASSLKWGFYQRDRENRKKDTKKRIGKRWDSSKGDIDAHIEQNEPNEILLGNEITSSSLRPLLVVSLISLIDYFTIFSFFFALVIVILTFAHEVYLSIAWVNKILYRLTIIILWLAFYFMQVYKFCHMAPTPIDKSDCCNGQQSFLIK